MERQNTLFWILAAHGQLDRERQSKDSRNMRCIVRPPKIWIRPLLAQITCPAQEQGSDGEKHTGNSDWQNAFGKPFDGDQEISWTELPWIQKSLFSMRRFKSWLLNIFRQHLLLNVFYQSWSAWDGRRAFLILPFSDEEFGYDCWTVSDKRRQNYMSNSSPAEYSTMGQLVLDWTSLAYQPKSRERFARLKKHVTFSLSNFVGPKFSKITHKNWTKREMINLLFVQTVQDHAVSEDEDDKPWSNLATVPSIKEWTSDRKAWICRGTQSSRSNAPLRRRKGSPVWRDPSTTLEQDVSGNSRERSEEEA